jgi:hypothetical protein
MNFIETIDEKVFEKKLKEEFYYEVMYYPLDFMMLILKRLLK